MARPFVYVNMAMTADGKITSASREYPRFTSDRDRRTMDRLRAEADAVIVGAGTIRADDPPLGVRDAEMKLYRASLGRPADLLNVVVTASASLDVGSRFFSEPAVERIVATVEDAPADRLTALRKHAEVWTVGRGQVDLPELCRRLHDRGVRRLLLEGGGETNWGFLRDGLVDEIFLTVAPSILGGRDAPTPVEGEGLAMADQQRLRLVSLERIDDELFCRYAVVREDR